jgi:zinc transporter, ZIP family
MKVSSLEIALVACIPMLVAFIGGSFASFYVLKGRTIAMLQHFVAGIVIGAASIELLPDIIGKNSSWTVGIGFAFGAATMLGVHLLSQYLADKGGREGFPAGTVLGSGIDLLIDGILIGLAFLAGKDSGVVIAVSLSLCALFLNIAMASTLAKRQIQKSIQFFVLFSVPLMLPLGAFLGSAVISQLPAIILTETIAFAVAALFFLGIEELLAEAHVKEHDTASVTAAFFIGFLVILLFRV